MNISTINPASGEVIQSYPARTRGELDNIIASMHLAWQTWSKTALHARIKCLRNLADLLLKTKQESAVLISTEMGKPITQALAEVEKCAKLCEYYADNAEAFLAPEMVQTEFYKSYRTFQPLGIVFAIMPWNFPFWQVMRFAVPNLVAGNAGLLKHAPNCSGCGLRIEELMLEAGFPENVFRSLIFEVEEAAFVIDHPAITGVTLTGSGRAGRSVAAEAGKSLKKVVLELGGSDPYIILEDADLDQAASQCVMSRLNNAGQVCIAAKRIIVMESVYQPFLKLLMEKVKNYVAGDPLLPETTMGPMAREDLRSQLDDQVQRSIKAGAVCLQGGKMPSGKGYYYPPTVLTDVKPGTPAFEEELFGPVICVISAKDEKEALKLANQTEFGLAGAVFTKNLEKGETWARENIAAGVCAVNSLVSSDPRLPFGGIRQSGYGRELGLEGMREFINIKTVFVAK